MDQKHDLKPIPPPFRGERSGGLPPALPKTRRPSSQAVPRELAPREVKYQSDTWDIEGTIPDDDFIDISVIQQGLFRSDSQTKIDVSTVPESSDGSKKLKTRSVTGTYADNGLRVVDGAVVETTAMTRSVTGTYAAHGLQVVDGVVLGPDVLLAEALPGRGHLETVPEIPRPPKGIEPPARSMTAKSKAPRTSSGSEAKLQISKLEVSLPISKRMSPRPAGPPPLPDTSARPRVATEAAHSQVAEIVACSPLPDVVVSVPSEVPVGSSSSAASKTPPPLPVARASLPPTAPANSRMPIVPASLQPAVSAARPAVPPSLPASSLSVPPNPPALTPSDKRVSLQAHYGQSAEQEMYVALLPVVRGRRMTSVGTDGSSAPAMKGAPRDGQAAKPHSTPVPVLPSTIGSSPANEISAPALVEPIAVEPGPMALVEVDSDSVEPLRLELDPVLQRAFHSYYPSNRPHYVPIQDRPRHRPTLASQRLAKVATAAQQIGMVAGVSRRSFSPREVLQENIRYIHASSDIEASTKSSLLEQLERCHDVATAWQNAFNEVRGNQAKFETFASFEGRRLVNLVGDLAPSQHVLLPGGVQRTSGQSYIMFYSITREAEESFTFTVYNAGVGTHHHPKHRDANGWFRPSRRLDISGISPAVLLGERGAEFLTKLIMFHRTADLAPADAVDAIYRTICEDLEGVMHLPPSGPNHPVKWYRHAASRGHDALKAYLTPWLPLELRSRFFESQRKAVFETLERALKEAKQLRPANGSTEALALDKEIDNAMGILRSFRLGLAL